MPQPLRTSALSQMQSSKKPQLFGERGNEGGV